MDKYRLYHVPKKEEFFYNRPRQISTAGGLSGGFYYRIEIEGKPLWTSSTGREVMKRDAIELEELYNNIDQ